MGCGGSKQLVVPIHDDLHDRDNGEGPGSSPAVAHRGIGAKSVRLLGGSVSKRQIDRKVNRSFFDKSRSAKGFKAAKSRRASLVAFNSRTPNRPDASPHQDGKPAAVGGTKSRFARSLMAVTDAVFGPPPEWILRQTAPIKSQYQFLNVVGRGQFGQVYCIRSLQPGGARYACKTLGKRKLLSQLDADDIKREIEVMHHLRGHPAVVGLHGVLEDERHVYLVMDLCGGGDLYELLREARFLGEERAAPLMLQALRAVQYCHSMGVLHRDIKPENFLLARKGELGSIKLTDFGLSTFYQEGQVFTELLGSPYYIAPEVIRQKYGREADIWSCGVMLYIMLCGEAPFFGEGDEGIFKSIMRAKLDFSFEPWPSLSAEVKALLRRMLVKDPRERASLEEVLAHSWFARFAGASSFDPVLGCGPGVGAASGRISGDSSAPAAATSPAAMPLVAGRTGAPASILPPLHSGAVPRPPPQSSCLGPFSGPSALSSSSAFSAASNENPLFHRLKRYCAASRTRKAALRYIVAGALPEEVTAGLCNLFADFDADCDEVVDVRELQQGFLRRGVVLLEEEAAALVHAADLDGDGVLSLVEWLAATIHIAEGQVDSLVSEAFAYIDADGDGFLSLEELADFLGGATDLQTAAAAGGGAAAGGRGPGGLMGQQAWQLAELIIAEGDLDGDGRLSGQEFRVAYDMMVDKSRVVSRAEMATATAAGGRWS
ncbi:hypothetical protein Agub_g6128, partial [Astrephomene gubernaculifera]